MEAKDSVTALILAKSPPEVQRVLGMVPFSLFWASRIVRLVDDEL